MSDRIWPGIVRYIDSEVMISRINFSGCLMIAIVIPQQCGQISCQKFTTQLLNPCSCKR